MGTKGPDVQAQVREETSLKLVRARTASNPALAMDQKREGGVAGG